MFSAKGQFGTDLGVLPQLAIEEGNDPQFSSIYVHVDRGSHALGSFGIVCIKQHPKPYPFGITRIYVRTVLVT